MKNNSILKSEYLKMLPSVFLIMLATSAYGLLNSLIVGNFCGSKGLAAMGIITPLTGMIYAFSSMMNFGTLSVCGNYFGEGKIKGANSAFTTSLICGSAVGAVLTLVSLIFPRLISSLLGSNVEMLDSVADYLKGMSFGMIPLMINSTICSYIHMGKKHHWAIISVIIQITINVALDFYFILCLNKGIFYVGLATSIGSITAMIILLICTYSKDSVVKIKPSLFRFSHFVNSIKYGSNSGFMETALAIRNLVINYYLVNVGGADAVSAWSVMLNVGILMVALSDSNVEVSQILFSISVGEKDKKSVKEIWSFACKVGRITTGVVALIMIIFVKKIAMCFGLTGQALDYASFL